MNEINKLKKWKIIRTKLNWLSWKKETKKEVEAKKRKRKNIKSQYKCLQKTKTEAPFQI